MSLKHDQLGEQTTYYTNRWNGFQHINGFELQRIVQVLEWVVTLNLPKNARFCDLGCGAGWSTAILGTIGDATGVDLSDVTFAQLRYPFCRFVSVDIMGWD